MAEAQIQVDQVKGLSVADVRQRLQTEGYNELPSKRRRNTLTIALEVLREPMFMLLVAAGVIYLLVGDRQEALVLLASVMVIIGITIKQERKTEHALEALRELSSPRALVIRDGVKQRIAGRELVRGDILVLKEGDRVPADARLLDCHDLKADESLLTGESVPVTKSPWDGIAEPAIPGGDELPFVYSGTLLVQGNGIAEVVSTGPRSELGKIGHALQSIEPETTMLQRETRFVVVRLAVLGIGLAVLAALMYALLRGDWLNGMLVGLTLAMAILPEEFPVVLTVFLALGAWRISRNKVLTRRMPAIETLGAATVLCVDKTGTLTLNHMAVNALYTDAGAHPVNAVADPLPAGFNDVIEYAVLSSEINPFDPMERAIHDLANQQLSDRRNVHKDWNLVREYPLSPEILAHTHVWQAGQEPGYTVAAKGAPEAISALCGLDEARSATIDAEVQRMARGGLRVLGVARAWLGKDRLPEQQGGFDFEWLGLVGLADPVRPEVRKALAECHSAGVRVVMVTGDYPVTAQSIARSIGLKGAGDVMTGEQLAGISDGALREHVGKVNIFARVAPQQKLRLVEALKSNGEVVAMTGDGVNDAPALKAAHIGIAMGQRGTDVAREAASLVLLGDDFESIVHAIRLGRRIYRNIRHAMSYLLAVHVPIAGMAFMPLVMGWPIAFLPVHIVFFEFVIDPACSIAFEAEQVDDEIMQRPPRPPDERLFDSPAVVLALLQGAAMLAATVWVYSQALETGSEETARALAFTAIVLGNLGLILANRSHTRSLFTTLFLPNPSLYWITGGALIALAASLYLPYLAALFRFSAPGSGEFIACIAAVAAGLTWYEIYKGINRLSQANRS